MRLSHTEENYLKAVYQHSEGGKKAVTTNALAAALHTSPAAVTDMVQKLHEKGLVAYQKDQGVNISAVGKTHALQVLRKHLLWEVFLVEKLKMGWGEVHEIAEQLEHIHSPLLIQRLDDFLGHPTYSPHGSPIPNAQGELAHKEGTLLADAPVGSSGIIVAVKDGATEFLQYLSKRGIYLGAKITVIEKIAFDLSMDISIDNLPQVNVSPKVSENLLIDLLEQP
ncbi:MAG: metal-dependent transcriptional regulator [Bacteroidota bacterium]